MIGEYEPLLDSLVGRDFNDLAIPPGAVAWFACMHMTLSMVEGVYMLKKMTS